MSDNKESITVVVNGAPVEVTANPNAALVALIAEALRASQNTGQPPENWDLKDATGHVIDPHQKLRDLGLAAGAKLYLSVKAGVGGDA